MSTTTQFTPIPTSSPPFQFQATLDGNQYNIATLWNVFGQRWYIQVTDQTGVLVVNKPLIGSDPTYLVSMVAGYFTSTLAYYPNTQTFVVSP